MQGLILDKEVLFIIGLPIWLISRILIILLNKRKKVKHNLKREFVLNIFVFYLFVLVGVTLLPIIFHQDENRRILGRLPINIIPLNSIIQQISRFNDTTMVSLSFQIRLFVMNIGGNIILLLPFSLFVPILWSKYRKFSSCVLLGFLVSFSIEILQLFENILSISMARITDIDDLILNTIGLVLGFGAYKIIDTFIKFIKSTSNIF